MAGRRAPILRSQPAGGSTLAWFTCDQLLDEARVAEAGRQLSALLAQSPRLALSFRGVGQVSSSLVARLFAAHRQVSAACGQLVLCDVGPPLAEVFRVTRLDARVPVYPDEAEALEALGGDSARP